MKNQNLNLSKLKVVTFFLLLSLATLPARTQTQRITYNGQVGEVYSNAANYQIMTNEDGLPAQAKMVTIVNEVERYMTLRMAQRTPMRLSTDELRSIGILAHNNADQVRTFHNANKGIYFADPMLSGLTEATKGILQIIPTPQAMVGSLLVTPTSNLIQNYINERTRGHGETYFRNHSDSAPNLDILARKLHLYSNIMPEVGQLVDSQLFSTLKVSTRWDLHKTVQASRFLPGFRYVDEQLQERQRSGAARRDGVLRDFDSQKSTQMYQEILTSLQTAKARKQEQDNRAQVLQNNQIKYEAYSIWQSNAVTIARLAGVNERTVGQFVTLTSAAMLIDKTRDMLQDQLSGKMSSALVTGNFIAAGLQIISLLGPQGESADQKIFAELQSLRKDIEELKNLMIQSFVAVERRLIAQHLEQMNALEKVLKTQAKHTQMLDSLSFNLAEVLSSHSRNLTKTDFAVYQKAMKHCRPQKFGILEYGPKPTSVQINGCLQAMSDFAFDISKWQSYQASDYSFLDPAFPFANSLREIGEVVSKYNGNLVPYLYGSRSTSFYASADTVLQKGRFPTVTSLSHPAFWINAADDAKFFSETFSTKETKWKKVIINVGKNILHFLAELSTLPVDSESSMKRRLNVGLLTELIEQNLKNLRYTAVDLASKTAELTKTSTLPLQPHLTMCKDLRADLGSMADVYSANAERELGRQGWVLKTNQNAPEQEYWNFASFRVLSGSTQNDIKFTVALPEQAIQNLDLPNEYLLAAKMGLGQFSVCIEELRFNELVIRTIGGEFSSGLRTQKKIWQHQADLTLRFEFTLQSKAPDVPPTFAVSRRKFVITRQNPGEDVNGRDPDSIIRINTLTDDWNERLMPCFKFFGTCAQPPREIFSSAELEATLQKFKPEFAVRLKQKRSELLDNYASNNAELKERKKLQQALQAAYYLGANALFEGPKGKNLKQAFTGATALPTLDFVQREVLENGKSAEQVIELAEARSKKLIRETERLANEEFEAFYLDISKYLIQLEGSM